MDGGSRRWALFGERLAIEYANTVFGTPEGCREGLDAPDALADWARAHDLTTVAPSAADFGRALELRDAIRVCLAAAETGDPPAPTAVDVVNRCSAAAPVVPVLRLTGGSMVMSASETADPVDALLGACARDAIELLGTEARRRVRNCARPVCPMFFEQTHPRRTWCSNYCGDAMRHARQYERTRSP